jgi:hypothetical protein
MLTLFSTAVASGHPNAERSARLQPSLRKFRQSSRSLCVIKSAPDKRLSLKPHSLRDTPQASAAFRVCVPVVVNGSQDQRQRIAKVGVGGFHSSQSLAASSGVETFTS